MPSPDYLSKSRYAAGLQCSRRLWLNVHEPSNWDEPALGSAEGVGLEIGRMARLLLPGGILVEEKPWEHLAAVAHTTALMADHSVPAIFEAAFEHSGIRIRVDVMERLSREYWRMVEVKSSGEVKEHHYDDAAIQMHVLRQTGVRLSSVQILHVNKDYVRDAGEISWPQFFRRAEIKAEVTERLDGIEARLREQFACLSRAQMPQIEPDAHCHTPFLCEYWDRCTESKPADWVFKMPRLQPARLMELKALGVESISAIPDNFELTQRQCVIRDVVRSGRPYVAPDLPERLNGLGPPAFYLDFEAFSPAIPLYPGTRPYEAIPFQWSLHRVDSHGLLNHEEFLADAMTDPRRSFAESLIAALGETKLPIIVFSSYEQTRLNVLMSLFPDLANLIGGIVRRLSDFLPIVRGGVYHPEFDFSYSIKGVAPALCSDVTYDDLEQVADGTAASMAFWLMASGRANAAMTASLRRSLLAYCQRDTWAMVRLHQALLRLAGDVSGSNGS